jgi:hypothetical protein
MGVHNSTVMEIRMKTPKLGILILALSIVFPGISTIVAGFLAQDKSYRRGAIIIGLI